jgi:hypothetical protein
MSTLIVNLISKLHSKILTLINLNPFKIPSKFLIITILLQNFKNLLILPFLPLIPLTAINQHFKEIMLDLML